MDRELLATLVGSAATAASPHRLPLARLAGRSPSRADRTVPAALEWVRRWGYRPATAVVPACACASGRCVTCN